MTDKPLDTGHAYRVQMWTARVLGVVAAVEGIAICVLVGLLIMLFPLKEIQPMLLIGGSKDDRVWRVEPYEVGTRGWDLIAEQLVRDYVIKRETIDLQTEIERWQHVAWYSADDVFTEFRRHMGRENPNSPYERAKKERLTRSVDVAAVSMLNPAQFQVEFVLTDFAQGDRIRARSLIATLTVEFRQQAVRGEDRYLNPTGLTVVAYGLAEKSS